MSGQLSFPNILPKTKVTASFDTPQMSSDSGVLLLGEVDALSGVTAKLSSAIQDKRSQGYVVHCMSKLLKQRIFQICQGYEDANDCDHFKGDVAFKTAVGNHSIHGTASDLCSQPTMTRLENSVTGKDLIRLFYAQIDLFCESYVKEPESIVLDVDPTVSLCYGGQQLSKFNGHVGDYGPRSCAQRRSISTNKFTVTEVMQSFLSKSTSADCNLTGLAATRQRQISFDSFFTLQHTHLCTR